MYKVIGILKRPDGVTVDAFHKWWLEEHALRVKRWPGLKKYTINLAVTGDQRYDGVAEVWFDTKEDMQRIFLTQEGQTARESATRHAGELVILLTEEHPIVQ